MPPWRSSPAAPWLWACSFISLTSGVNTNVSNYMFGSILTISRSDAVLSVALCAAVLAVFTLFYPRIFAVTFDETFARATGTRAEGYNLLLAILTAVTVVLGMRMMGALLISSLMIFPALSAMKGVQELPGRHGLLCGAGRVLLCRGHDGLLRAGDALWRQCRGREHTRLRRLRPCGTPAAQVKRLRRTAAGGLSGKRHQQAISGRFWGITSLTGEHNSAMISSVRGNDGGCARKAPLHRESAQGWKAFHAADRAGPLRSPRAEV